MQEYRKVEDQVSLRNKKILLLLFYRHKNSLLKQCYDLTAAYKTIMYIFYQSSTYT